MQTQTSMPSSMQALEPSAMEAMVGQTRRFLRRRVDAIRNDREGVLPRDLLDEAAELGLYGLGIPAEYGGLDLTLGEISRLVAEVAYFDRALATSIGLHNGLGVWALVHRGSATQRSRWLPKLATGRSIAAFAATEAGAGSDLNAVATRVEASGDELRLNGEKQYVTNGALADVFTVLARVPGKGRRYQLLCVPSDSSGVSIGREERKLGIRASSTTPVRFEDVRLDTSAILGDPHAGLRDAYGALAIGRVVMSAGCIGTAKRAVDATLGHVTTRRQFRRPIGTFGASRTHVAAMAARLFAMEALVDQVDLEHRCGREIDSLATVAKIFCSEGAFEITDRALQLHGAMGVLEDTGVALLARDCRVTRIFEGANDVLLVLLGSELLSRPGSTELRRMHSTHVPRAETWEHVHDRWVEACDSIRRTIGVRVVERQDLLHAVARAHVALTAASVTMASRSSDPRLADFGASRWTAEASSQLDSCVDADMRLSETFALTDELYAATRWRSPTRKQ